MRSRRWRPRKFAEPAATPLPGRASPRSGQSGSWCVIAFISGPHVANIWTSPWRKAQKTDVLHPRSSSFATSPRPSARCARSRTSISRSIPARSSACSATTAPANRRWSRPSWAFTGPIAGGEIYFHGKRIDDWSVARAREPRHRDRLSGARPLRKAADLAQHVHGPRAAHQMGPARRQAHARRIRPADERAHGLHLGRGASRQCGDHHVGRRKAGRRDHPRALFRCRSW